MGKYLEFIQKLITLFNSKNIEYMIIGGGAAILQGYNGVTQDIDLYIKKEYSNNRKVLDALLELGFVLSEPEQINILKGKSFIQFDEPFELDLVFDPDGFENYEEALQYKILIQGIPVMSLKGIIKSKKAANRKKDKLAIPMLLDFERFLKRKTETFDRDDYFTVPDGFRHADNQTLNRWKRNLNINIWELLSKGVRQ